MERQPVKSFEDLLVWQKGIALAKQIYQIIRSTRLQRDFGLSNQLQRAAVSIPTNIAEGFERSSTQEYIRFLVIAKGSAGELRSLIREKLLPPSPFQLFPFDYDHQLPQKPYRLTFFGLPCIPINVMLKYAAAMEGFPS